MRSYRQEGTYRYSSVEHQKRRWLALAALFILAATAIWSATRCCEPVGPRKPPVTAAQHRPTAA